VKPVQKLRQLTILAVFTLGHPFSPAEAQGLLLKNYSTSDGLPDSRVAPIMQDREGYLWFGTQAGLTRYNGRQFENFGPAHEIPGIFGRSILQDHLGAIWFGYSGFNAGGLIRISNGPKTAITHKTGLTGNQVFVVAEDHGGDFWVATDVGLERVHFLDSSRTRWISDGPYDTAVSAIYVDKKGSIWYAGANGLFKGRARRFTRVFETPSSDRLWHVRPYSFFETQSGDLWFGSYRAAYTMHDGHVTILGHADGVPPRGVWCFREDLDGTLWAGTMNGLYKIIHTGRKYHLIKEQSFGNDVVYDMCLDREGNLWFASAPGLRKLLAKGLVVSFSGQHELATPGFGPILASPEGPIDFGSRTTGLYSLHSGKVSIRRDYGLSWTYTITSLHADPGGELWLGLWRKGAMHLQGVRHRLYTSRDGLPSDNVHAFLRLDDNRLLIGTSAGLACLHSDGTVNRLTSPSFPDPAIFDLKAQPSMKGERHADTIWAATDHGVMRLALDSSGIVASDTLAGAPQLSNRIVYEILVDNNRRLWFGTDGAGVYVKDGDHLSGFTEEDGLAGNRVYALAEDSVGNIWIGTSAGISCFDGVSLRNFTFRQGFGETGVHGLITDRQGYLWVSSFPGIKKLKPFRFHKSLEPPPLYLTDVQVEGTHLPLEGDHELDPDPAVITFRFAALSYTDENSVRYRYLLEGFDRAWSRPEQLREIRYTHLPPGAYTFRVLARSGDGVSTPRPLAFSFTILPPVWLRWWFISLAAVAAAAAVYALYRFRLNKLLELERTRSKIALDLHDDIGSSLTRISVMTEVAQRRAEGENGNTAEYLTKVGETARELIESLGDIVWAVDPKHDTLQNAIRRIVQFGQDMCDGKEILLETELNGTYDHVRLSPEQRRDVYLIFKEAIHNVVRHSGASRVRFCATSTKSGVLLELLDNGTGLPEAPSGERHGLTSIRERAQRVGTHFSMTGKKDEGTRISLELKTG
jgi:signal transduction histidine kinase/streptogramin lyase